LIKVPLCRTGIEQPFLKKKPIFIRKHKEFEPIFDSATINKALVEEYKAKEQQNTNLPSKVVYDCFDTQSPYYDKNQYIRP
jgi:hypothetical protein